MVGQAYDEAWQDIAGNFGEDRVLAARLKLANIILATATADSRDVDSLDGAAEDGTAVEGRHRATGRLKPHGHSGAANLALGGRDRGRLRRGDRPSCLPRNDVKKLGQYDFWRVKK